MAAEPPGGPRAPGSSTVASPKFDVLEYDVEGNTLLRAIEIEKAVTPFLGPSRSIKDVEAAREQLERVYHDKGYKTVLVSIPQQQVSGGTVRLVVTEAPVGRLDIAGSHYHSLPAIEDKMRQLDPGTVPNFNEVQKELGDVNRSADLKVTPILRASQTPGKVDVELSVKDELPFHATIEADNRYSPNTSHIRLNGGVSYDNLFQRDQSASFQYQIAPQRPEDAKIWSASYVIPLPDHLVTALYAVHSDSNIAAVGGTDVIGRGNIYGLRLIAPLPTSSLTFFHSITGGVDYKDFKESVLLQGANGSLDSPVSYPPFTVQYSATWLGAAQAASAARAATAFGRSSTGFDIGFNFLISGLGTDWRQFAAKRADAGRSYLYLRPKLTHEQILPGSWTLAAIVDGQVSSGPLINNEQYSAGGADSVRGYTEAERLADNGVRGTLELRTPQMSRAIFPHPEEAWAFVFTDAAHLRVIEPLPGQESSFTLWSAGIGLHLKAGGFSLTASGARILEDGFVTPAGRYRGLFSAGFTY